MLLNKILRFHTHKAHMHKNMTINTTVKYKDSFLYLVYSMLIFWYGHQMKPILRLFSQINHFLKRMHQNKKTSVKYASYQKFLQSTSHKNEYGHTEIRLQIASGMLLSF